MNINFFENLVVIFQSEWIMFFTLLIMFTIYAIKFDVSHEVTLLFLLAFISWFSFLFLDIWVSTIIIIGSIAIVILNIIRAVR